MASDPSTASCLPAEGMLSGLRLTQIVTGLDEPTFVTAAPGDDTRSFVLEKSGAVRVVRDGQLLPEPFLNLRERVATANEEGLVGLAFHPRYQENGRFFIQYALLDSSREPTEDQQIVLSEFVRSAADPDRADAASERRLMLVEQPASIHMGGMLAFGPRDGMLYISRGDGGSTASQDLDSWLGKMLRIDVDSTADGQAYGIPAGNMSGAGVLPEIWSRGFRNPWRFGFDTCTADLYIGDVGENSFEEIDFEPANTPGRNYGWRTLEGPRCFDETASCDPTEFTLPVMGYEHDFGCTVISGYVYRGQRIPALRGTYLYADYCSGNFGSFRLVDGQVEEAREITADINPDSVTLLTSFGTDNAGELYVVSQLGGLYRIDPE
jgi:glucose/arabinose dehydrogenase